MQLIVVCAHVSGIIALVAILVSSASALPSTAFRTSLSQVGEWIDQTGKPTVIRGVVAEALGFPNADIRVRERGFRTTNEQFTHVCSTADLLGFENVVFLASVDEATGDALVWRATRKGDLISSARFAAGVAEPLRNDAARTAFLAEKAYFVRQMRTPAFRTNAAPVPVRQTPPPHTEASEGKKIQESRNGGLPSEVMVLVLNPWVVPVIATILVIAAHGASPRRE
jgi:hypothetical protein